MLLAACQALPVTTQQDARSAEDPASEESGARGSAALPAPDIDPAGLLGKEPAAVAQLLGAPDLERVEDPALIWQYRGPECVVDLFFYPLEGGGAATGKAVVHLEARDAEISKVDARSCLNKLLAGRQRAML